MPSKCDTTPSDSTQAAIGHFRDAIGAGRHWYVALLEASTLWTATEECIEGRTYHYLIGAEAFDFLLFAERMLGAVPGVVPEDEKINLLFKSIPPLELPPAEMKDMTGEERYQQYLNFFYGVTVEEALILAVQEEVRKEERNLVYKGFDQTVETFRRVYDAERNDLMIEFRRCRHERPNRSLKLTELKEFTYWLFKYRLKHTDKARVASDTKKALAFLKSIPVRSPEILGRLDALFS